jgi:ABC-type multidrug transport system fused ATPase/permease subunit
MWARGGGGGAGGGGRGGIDEDQKLDRTQTLVVLKRSIGMAGEFRRQALWALVLVIFSVLCTLAGPVLVRHGIDAGIKTSDSRTLNFTVIAYIVVVLLAYFVGRVQYVGFCVSESLRICRNNRWLFLTARRPVCWLHE